MSKCKTIAIANQKGGVGKTTTTLSLGVALANNNKKVLVVDADPQANLTTYMGFYDEFGNAKQVKIGNQIVTTKSYENNNGNVQNETFANNQVLAYTYDRFNRLNTKESSNGSYTYTYNADSNIKRIVDTINNNTKNFTYDLAQRLIKEINTNGFTKEYGYDINNNVNDIKYTLNDTQHNVKYNY